MTAERPGFTNGTDIVPTGHVQLELGYRYDNGRDGWEHHYGDTSQLRVPVTSRLEVRAGLPAFDSLHPDGGGSFVGWEDSSASLKWKFLDELTGHRPSLALIAGTTLPTGSPGLRERNLQPQVDLESAYNLSTLWQLGASAVYTRASDDGQRFDQYSGALNIGYSLSGSTSLFAETYRIAPTGAAAPNGDYLDGGVTYLVSRFTQLDISTGVGISSGVKGDHFIGAGIARRW